MSTHGREVKLFSSGVLVGVLACGLLLSGFWWRAARAAALRQDAIEAAADTTRRVLARSFSGAVIARERRAVQAELRADALDRELRRRTAALAVARVAIDSLAAGVVAEKPAEVIGADVRVASYRIDQPPFHVTAIDTVPPPPARPRLALAIRLDAIPMSLRLMCGARDRLTGVAPASVLVESPPWAQVTLERVQQAPEICSPVPRLAVPNVGFGGAWRWGGRALLVGAGVYIGSR